MKLARYEKAGVPEYWIVDPQRQLVEPYRLRGNAYQRLNVARESITLAALEGVEVDLQAVWLASASAT